MIEIEELRNVDRIARVEIAGKVGRLLKRQSSTSDDSTEDKTAMAVAQLLAEDASIAVREALSLELRSCSYLPETLIEKLVNDIDQVSMPFLMASDAVDDGLLEKLVRGSNEAAQEAIAKRNGLSEQVSFAICDTAGRDAVENLMENETADLSLRSCERVTERFPADQLLLEIMAERSDLPPDIVEKLIFKVSAKYGEYLMNKFNLAEDYTSYLTGLAGRKVFINTLNRASVDEIENYFKQLNRTEGLTSDVLLSYLQNNMLRLFIAALSVLTTRSFSVIEKGLSQGGRAVLQRLLSEAGISKGSSGVLLVAFDRLVRGG